MSTVLRLSAFLLIAASLAACNKSDPAAPAGEAAAAAPAEAPRGETAAKPATADGVTAALTMDKARAFAQALKNLRDIGVTDVAMEPDQTLAEYAARIESVPQVRAEIEKAGLSAGEFAYLNNALIGAVMAQGMIESGQMKTLPESIDPAAVEFVRQNKAEIHALLESVESGA